MPKIKVLSDFKFAERGVEVIEYTAGVEVVEVSEECAKVAFAEKWAEPADENAAAKKGRRAQAAAPTVDPTFSDTDTELT